MRVRIVCSRSSLALLISSGCLLGAGCGDGSDDPSPEPGTTEDPTLEKYENADLVRGGQLYDRWWAVTGVKDPAAPTSDNPGYARTEGSQTGSSTWRCKECHGWDYQGKDGAYSSGSHFTGVPGLYVARSEEASVLYQSIKSGLAETAMSPFEAHLSDTDIWDLVKFIREGLIDDRLYIDYATGAPLNADPVNGQSLFEAVCATCHGLDGKTLNFGDEVEPEYLGTIANDNAWEFLHKVRFGQPGELMPSAEEEGWPIGDVVDVLGYARTLPEE